MYRLLRFLTNNRAQNRYRATSSKECVYWDLNLPGIVIFWEPTKLFEHVCNHWDPPSGLGPTGTSEKPTFCTLESCLSHKQSVRCEHVLSIHPKRRILASDKECSLNIFPFGKDYFQYMNPQQQTHNKICIFNQNSYPGPKRFMIVDWLAQVIYQRNLVSLDRSTLLCKQPN